jgi:hypothetical protein
MKINFNLCEAKTIRKDLKKVKKLKNRWLELISGWQQIEPERDLDMSKTILNVELILFNLLKNLEKAEAETIQTEQP